MSRSVQIFNCFHRTEATSISRRIRQNNTDVSAIGKGMVMCDIAIKRRRSFCLFCYDQKWKAKEQTRRLVAVVRCMRPGTV